MSVSIGTQSLRPILGAHAVRAKPAHGGLYDRHHAALSRIAVGFAAAILLWMPGSRAEAQSNVPTFVSVDQSYGLTTYIKIEIFDGVEGGCWTNATSVESRAKLKFEQNDIRVIDYSPFFTGPFTYRLIVSANGFRSDGGLCVGNAAVQSHFSTQSEYGGANDIPEFSVSVQVVNFESSIVMLNSSTLNGQISDFVDGAVSELVAKVIAGRRESVVQEMKRALPGLQDKPLSASEWREMIDKETKKAKTP